MEKSKISSSEMIVKVLPEQMMTDEVNEIAEAVNTQETYEDLAGEPQTIKEEIVESDGTDHYFNKPTFEIQEDGCEGDSRYQCVMQVEQNECDCGDQFINVSTPQIETDITKKESPVHCKEEDLDIKYEDLETESTEWRHEDENGRGETRQELEVRENEESSIKLKQAGNRGHKLSSIHKAKSEIYLHKCGACSYAAKRSDSLKRHMLVHKSKSEVNLYKCHECSYAGKRTWNLKEHMLLHNANSPIHLFKCQECSYAAKRSGHLKEHMLVRKAKSEVDMHKCENCSYASKYVRNLKKHMLVHGVKPEVDQCSYEVKQSRELQTPMLVHVAKLGVNLYNLTYFLGESRATL